MNNPINDFCFNEMKRLSKLNDDDLETEYLVAVKTAEKTDMPFDWQYLELIEHEIAFRNRGSNSTWRPGRFQK